MSGEPFAELHNIWECIQNKNIQPALEWASRYSKELMAKNSTLEFKLHRLAYMQVNLLLPRVGSILTPWAIFQSKDFLISDSITRIKCTNGSTKICSNTFRKIRQHFPERYSNFNGSTDVSARWHRKFSIPNAHSTGNVDRGENFHLFSVSSSSPNRLSYRQAADTFLKDACSTLGIIKDSPLSIVTNAGCIALPALLNIKQVMISRQVPGIWSGRDELPVILNAKHLWRLEFF